MFSILITALVVGVVYTFVMAISDILVKKIDAKRRVQGRVDEFEALGVEKIEVPSLKPCPYCGLPLVVEHLREPWLEEPDFYTVEHKDLKAAIKADCPTLYVSFDSVEKTVEMMNRRAR